MLNKKCLYEKQQRVQMSIKLNAKQNKKNEKIIIMQPFLRRFFLDFNKINSKAQIHEI